MEEVYHVLWIALFSAIRWRLDVLTFLIKGFGAKIAQVLHEIVVFQMHCVCNFKNSNNGGCVKSGTSYSLQLSIHIWEVSSVPL